MKRLIALILTLAFLFTCIPTTFAAQSSSKEDVTRYSVLILDCSGSMSGTPMTKQKEAATKFCEAVLAADGTNYVAIVQLNTYSSSRTAFTSDLNTLTKTINGLYASGGTNIYQALNAADTLLSGITEQDNVVKNIVLCSDGLPQTGTYSYSGKYTSSDSSYYYYYGNAVYNKATTLKDAGYFIYTLGFFHSLSGKDLSFGQMLMNDVQNAGYYEVDNPEDLEFVFGEIADNITIDKTYGTFFFASGKERDYAATFYYDDAYFTQPASEYNPSLATMSLCFELSAWASNETDDYTKKSQNAENLLNKIGFSAIETNDCFNEKPSEDSMGVIAAYKTIDVDGTPTTLIAVATRGGGYEAEWAGNFTLGYYGRHQGFADAVDIAKAFLTDYVSSHKADFEENVKLWIAGYSRGGITANLVAADITNAGGIGGVTITKENIYAYCFEPPQGELYTDILTSSSVSGSVGTGLVTPATYTNIHNIVNPNDLVTKVAMSSWGFTRYGVNEKVIPTRLTSSNASVFEAMLAKFKALNTEETRKSVVYTDEGERHIIDTFQAKKLDPDVDVNLSGHWEKVDGFIFDYYVWVIDEAGVDVDIIVDSDKNMSTFLDDLILALTLGIGSRTNYALKLEDAVRIVAAEFMGGGYESYKWEQVPDIFQQKLSDSILDLAWAYISGGASGVSLLVTELLYESMDEAGIDVLAYATLPGALLEALESVVTAVVASLAISGVDDLLTLFENGSMLFAAHHPELCLAWLQMQDPNYTPEGHRLFVIDSYRIVHINCPVDVSVYNSRNELVAQIINDVPQKIEGSTIIAEFTADGEKRIYLPADDDFRVEITATGDGVLNYAVSEYSYAAAGYVKLTNYNNIPIQTGNVLNASVGKYSDTDAQDTADGSDTMYTLTIDGSDLTPTSVKQGEDAQSATYLVTAQPGNTESGYVNGGGVYVEGSFAQVSARPYDDCAFEGWYVGDTLVSTDAVYRFQVNAHTDLIAKFDGTRPPMPQDTQDPQPSEPSKYAVTASASKGGTIDPAGTQLISEGDSVTYTITADHYYKIGDVLVDGVSVGALESYTFSSVKAAHTIEVIFEEDIPFWEFSDTSSSDNTSSAGNKLADLANTYLFSYTDVLPRDWFYNDVTWAWQRGLADGGLTYQPLVNASRGTIVEFLWRLDGRMPVYEAPFTDTDEMSAAWASSVGVVNGYGNGKFGPTDDVTREQLAAILYRYAQHRGINVTARGNLSGFADDGKVSFWAADAMQWAVGAGIINGRTDGTLDPQGNATRAELATMLRRFATQFGV